MVGCFRTIRPFPKESDKTQLKYSPNKTQVFTKTVAVCFLIVDQFQNTILTGEGGVGGESGHHSKANNITSHRKCPPSPPAPTGPLTGGDTHILLEVYGSA